MYFRNGSVYLKKKVIAKYGRAKGPGILLICVLAFRFGNGSGMLNKGAALIVAMCARRWVVYTSTGVINVRFFSRFFVGLKKKGHLLLRSNRSCEGCPCKNFHQILTILQMANVKLWISEHYLTMLNTPIEWHNAKIMLVCLYMLLLLHSTIYRNEIKRITTLLCCLNNP